MTYLPILYAAIALVMIAWLAIPLMVFVTRPIPRSDKIKGVVSLVLSWIKSWIIFPFKFWPVSMIMVGIAVQFTKKDANKFPWPFWIWNNEVSINGDNFPWTHSVKMMERGISTDGLPYKDGFYGYPDPDETEESRIARNYYNKGADTNSKMSRWVFCGIRNRASMLAYWMGVKRTEGVTSWGNPNTGRSEAGWTVSRMGWHYEIYRTIRIWKLCYRLRFGYKIGHEDEPFPKPRCMVVSIPFSLLSWKGPST